MTLVEPARMCREDGSQLPLVAVEGRAAATGLVLDTTFRQHYRNDGDANIEAVYTFPLPQGAVLLGLAFTLGERRLVGVVSDRRKAEQLYEQALDEGHSAVLLEKSAEGLYTVSLGNLMAGEDAVVEVRYAQLLSFVDGAVRIAIPTVVAPRYGSALAAGIPHHAIPEADLLADYPARFTIELGGELAGGIIACPSHPARVHRHPGGATVSLEGSLDRDFVVTVDGLQARPLASVAPDGDGWVALASFLPPSPAEPAPEAGLRVKLLVDCSGSMAGDSIAQARRAVARLLEKLGERDQVDLSRFGSTVQHFHSMARATREHLARCRRWARALQADLGGTELLAALTEVFERGQPGDGAGDGADVFLITDGEVHEADEIVTLARQHRQRVFVVGVGSAPNESLLQRLAAQTGGSAELVTPNESIEDALMRLFARLRQPRVTSLAVDWPAQPDWSVPLPGALWAGETAHVIARFPGRPAGAATLRWREAGSERRMSIALPAFATTAPPADDPGASGGEAARGDALARLAAGLAVSSLPEEERGAFAERYQLVTDRTSMALVMQREGDARAQGLPEHVKIPQMLAAGWGGHGTVLLESACYAPAPDAYFSADLSDDMDEVEPTVFRHPAGASASLREFLESRTQAQIDLLAERVAQLLAQASRGPRGAGPELTLDALRPLLPRALEQALDDALLEHAADSPGEAALLAWLVVELARRCPGAFPRAALRGPRARSRGVVPPQTVVEALDALASPGSQRDSASIPAFLRHSR